MQSCESIISQTDAIYPLPKLCFLLLLLIPKGSLVKMYTISFSTASIDKGVWFVFIFLEEKSDDDFDGFFDIWALHRFAKQCALFLAGETLEFL